MGIDFDNLVLGPTVGTFGVPFVWYPSKSRPGNAPVPVSGVYSSAALNVEMADGQVFSDQQTTMGIRLSDWPWQPVRGDRFLHQASGIMYWQSDISLDGQGGATLQLRATEPAGDT
ncbi:hypothetical protein HAP48_0035010 [Bradyrhizobium septentrionale]|uniref:Phage tail protein n=1 Tax=Bradyrhizobium septentrionale TaxID=1404411 RepID=A0A974A061_9BRAD|nr:hypothetical protein [Bradyrhizobium septentrionale]UGY13744.1 hypothetical protein HAP48_0035010 [Bradyrhizobium septentrionale]